MGAFKRFLESQLGDVYVLPVTIGSSAFQDTVSGFFWSVNEQVAEVCDVISHDPQLRDGYNAIGFSQGGQFLRAVAQRCPSPRMRNLITIGAQHQGVYGVPHCPRAISNVCSLLSRIASFFAYFSWIQVSVQMQYWHDPLDEYTYAHHSAFLTDINQELSINEDYKRNLMALDNFVMIKFLNDTMVYPMETQLFGFFKPGQAEEIMTLAESEIYIQDKLGLQEMDKAGKIHMYSIHGNHLQFSDKWFVKIIVKKFLR